MTPRNGHDHPYNKGTATMLRTLILWASALLLTASMQAQSPFDLLGDSMKQVVRGWAANRTTDRQSLRFCALENLSLNAELAAHRNKDEQQEKTEAKHVQQIRLLTADNGAKDITIMNQDAKLNDLAPMKAWAWIGKGFVVCVGVAGVVTLYSVLK